MPKYTQQIVVFLDLLGFSSMLPNFEEEALKNDIAGEADYHESIQLNKLIEIFRNSIKLVRNAECNYYLFSDNLCIAIDYIDNDSEKPDILIQILTLISLLMNEFVKEGYFLRGGVDAGWFLDNRDIAVGLPLVNAYILESEKAIYPRVLISESFLQILNDYIDNNKLSDYSTFLAAQYLKQEGEFGYLNPFFYIINFEDKESKLEYLQTYSNKIKEKLEQFAGVEKIVAKYKWFATEFDSFITLYITDQAYHELDDDQLDYTDQELTLIQNLKINFNGV